MGRVLASAFDRPHFESGMLSTFVKAVKLGCAGDFPRIRQVLPKEDVLFVKFEDLAGQDTRYKTLRSIAEFLSDDLISDHRLESAYIHAEKFHRPPVSVFLPFGWFLILACLHVMR